MNNRGRVVDLLRRRGSLSLAELIDETGLSRATVSNLLSEFRRRGLVLNKEPRADALRAGRPPTMVALSNSVGAAIGITITHQAIRVAVADVGLGMLAEREVVPNEFDIGSDPRATLQLAAEVTRELLAAAGLDESRVVGGAIGVPAPIGSEGGVVGLTTLLPGWRGYRPADALGAILGFPVLVENDANLSALAEVVAGAAEGLRHVLYVEASAWIGAGLMIDGHLYHGRFGGAGEIAHVIVQPGGDICFCGRRGCLATIVFGARIAREVQQGLRRRAGATEFDPDALGDPDENLARNVDLVVGWALNGDPISSRVLKDVGHELGFAVANACQILNPECIVVGGALAKAGPIFMDPLTEAVHGLTTLLPGWPVPIVGGRLEERAELLGAVALGVRAPDKEFGARLLALVDRALSEHPAAL